MRDKYKKIRKAFEEWVGEFSEADIIADGEWIWDFILKSLVQREKEIVEEIRDMRVKDNPNLLKHNFDEDWMNGQILFKEWVLDSLTKK